MKKIGWGDRATGDIGLAACPGLLHNGIWEAEKSLHPDAPVDFQPSHVFIIGPVAGYLTEAWMDASVDSVAAVNADVKYASAAARGQIELWRPEGTPGTKFTIFQVFLNKYVPEAYGWPDLVGFEMKALFKETFGVSFGNPIFHRLVCSQAAGAYLTMLCDEGCIPELGWTHALELRDFDPLACRLSFLENESK